MRRILRLLWMLFALPALAQYVTLVGNIQASNGAPAVGYTLVFQPSQMLTVPSLGLVLMNSTDCGTTAGGAVVGVPDPGVPLTVTPQFSGTLPPGNYYIEFTFVTSGGVETLVSPETQAQLTATGGLVIQPPASGLPQGAAGIRIYVGTSSGSETFQGTGSGTGTFTLATPLETGTNPPTQNLTVCTQIANDAAWPTGTGYRVTLLDPTGNIQPSYPMTWQLLGPGTTINLSSGLPYYNGVTIYPTPLLANPTNHIAQSISGNLNFNGYNILNVGKLGVGTSTPGWPIDVENGAINTSFGYLYNGAAPAGSVLCGNGTAFVSTSLTSCAGGPSTIYYQHMQRNGSLYNQEPFLNFSTDFSLADNPGSTRTEVGLLATGVTAGTYTNPTLTVDANGRVDAATNGIALPIIERMNITTGICTTGMGAAATCNFTVTWTTPFADGNYTLVCSPNIGGAGGLTALMWSNKTATQFELTIQNGTASMAVATTLTEIDCIGVH